MSFVIYPSSSYNIQSFLDDVDGLSFRESFSSSSASEFHNALASALSENSNGANAPAYAGWKEPSALDCWQGSGQSAGKVLDNVFSASANAGGLAISQYQQHRGMLQSTNSKVSFAGSWPPQAEYMQSSQSADSSFEAAHRSYQADAVAAALSIKGPHASLLGLPA
eukprot:CAMPEP_0113666398 /NCGR_PEP_ID=MMETSP0038_2-20120614/2850_1 /TAXON_ID=2898 /ORGANISM="Cryptomonas paramecium" /LENGTH=165 /DNA_ID=CAMNT_0000581881 /DNA_START=197 /DNA_END=690 /DNA_ORIENTATION=- /assembly_acc=CAM_ASM_000170